MRERRGGLGGVWGGGGGGGVGGGGVMIQGESKRDQGARVVDQLSREGDGTGGKGNCLLRLESRDQDGVLKGNNR